MTSSELPTAWILGGIAVSGGLLVYSGIRLTRDGDALGEKHQLSKTWLGVLLLAAITSLPELIVTVSAQWAVARPALAIGNVCGSNLMNLCIFAVLDLLEGPGALSARLDRRLIRPALMGLLVMTLAMFGLGPVVFGWDGGGVFSGWPVSLLILSTAGFSIWQTERRDPSLSPPSQGGAKGGAAGDEAPLDRRLELRFARHALVVLLSGVSLILLCDLVLKRPLHVGQMTFVLNESVVGTILLAVITSLPELVVCVSAVSMGTYQMAVGNLFGSNIINMMILPLAHAAKPSQPFWTAALPIHLGSISVAMLLTCILVAGIRSNSRASVLRLGWDGMLVGVIGGLAVLAVTGLGLQL